MAITSYTTPTHYIGLSSDTKPTSAPIGATYLAYDTGDLYICRDGTNWVIMPAPGQLVDDGAFTAGSSAVTPVGAVFDDASTDSVSEGDAGAVRMTANRILMASLRGKATAEGDVPILTSPAGRIEIASGTGAASLNQDNMSTALTGIHDGGASDVERGLWVGTYGYAGTGNNFDRWRNNVVVSVLASAARTATPTTVDIITYNARGIRVTLNETAHADTPSVVLSINAKDPVSGVYTALLSSAAITGEGTTTMVVYPGCVAVANTVANLPLARTIGIIVTHSNTDSITYSVSAELLI